MTGETAMPETETAEIATPEEILQFWFHGPAEGQWFQPSEELDEEIRYRFLPTYRAAMAGKLPDWEQSPGGALSLVIVLDQFPRNIFRGEAEAFESGPRALEVANRAIDRGYDGFLSKAQKAFIYIPFMHSESIEDQDRAVALCEAKRLDDHVEWAHHHRAIIQRFGRFPHRNALLGRESTPEEEAYLADPEAFKG